MGRWGERETGQVAIFDDLWLARNPVPESGPLLIFDSGLGGLGVLALRRHPKGYGVQDRTERLATRARLCYTTREAVDGEECWW